MRVRRHVGGRGPSLSTSAGELASLAWRPGRKEGRSGWSRYPSESTKAVNPNDVAKMKCVIVLRCFAKAAPKVIQSELESRADDLRVDVFVCQVLTMLLELVGVSVPSSWKSKAFNDQDIVYASAGESLTAAPNDIT